MRLEIRRAIVKYEDFTVLDGVDFEIRDNEKIAVVGRNGSGKTTLLKLIARDLDTDNKTSDEGAGIFTAGEQSIGFLKQISFPDGSVTVEEEIKKVFAPVFLVEARMAEIEVLLKDGEDRRLYAEYDHLQKEMEALGGYSWKRDMEIMFRRFGFDPADLKKPMGEFSGGQQTKIAFIKLLLSRPDIMLLDEPTNHLDLPTIEWLEGYLRDYPKAVVIVSHDRMFLDRVTTVTYEIEYHKMTRYPGNYSAFVRMKEEALKKQEKDYEEQQAEIRRLTEWIEKWKNTPSKVAATRSKRKVIEHMVKIPKPVRFDTRTFRALFTPRTESYSEVLYAKDLTIGYDRPLSTLSFRLMKGERLAVIGENGKGKSTLLKTLTGTIPALSGVFRFGTNVEWNYYDQQQAVLLDADPYQTVLENFWEAYPHLLREEVRSALGAFMFSQDDVEKEMGVLSGGEKVRLALCKVFYTKPNLLILDEPTNHMDIESKEVFEEALQEFEGTAIIVSHDRYFLQKIPTRILELTPDGMVEYLGKYDYYLERKAMEENAAAGERTPSESASEGLTVKEERALKKAAEAEERRRKREIEGLEAEIENLEEKIAEIEAEMQKPENLSDFSKLAELSKEMTKLREDLDSAYVKWEGLQEL